MKRILLAVTVLLLLGAGCANIVPSPAKPGPDPQPVACTMEAKICPDGSAVGRIGPKCEFAPCPR